MQAKPSVPCQKARRVHGFAVRAFKLRVSCILSIHFHES
jgi:hypothetical protein